MILTRNVRLVKVVFIFMKVFAINQLKIVPNIFEIYAYNVLDIRYWLKIGAFQIVDIYQIQIKFDYMEI